MQSRRIGRDLIGLGPFFVALGRRGIGYDCRIEKQYQNSWLAAYCSSCWCWLNCVEVR